MFLLVMPKYEGQQKSAVRVILKRKYTSYKDGLRKLNIPTLEKRRELLCLRFAKRCLENDKVKNLFPKVQTKHKMKKRNEKKYKENKTKTTRYKKSAIPFMQKLLNKENEEKRLIMEF